MADIAAPYFSGNDLTAQPGDANLSGVQANFDPSVKAPLAAIQQTIDRQDAENFQAQKQRQQQERQFQHDLLVRQMENEQQEKVLKYQQGIKDRQQLFNMFNQTGATAASLKDQGGNDMSIPFLPEDNEKLVSETNDLQKWAFESPTQNLYSPELQTKMNDLKQKRTNASLRTIYYKQAEQAMTNAYDPEEKERLKKYMEDIKTQPLAADKMPHPYMEQPTIKPLIDAEKDYKDGKGYEEFGDNGSGVPNARYLGLAATTDPRLINEGFKRYQFFRSQPEGQSVEAYQQWKQRLDELTDARDLPRMEFPVVATNDGKVAFDESSRAKQQSLARNFLAATELMNNGYLKQPDAEDVLKQQELEARVDKEKATAQKERVEAQLKSDELKNGKPLTGEQQETKKYVRSVYSQAQGVFSPKGRPEVAKGNWMGNFGVDPTKYNIYTVGKDAGAKYIGLEEPGKKTKVTGSGTETVTESKGRSVTPDQVYLIEDKATGDKKLMFVKDNKSIAKVSEKDAVINALKHEAKYDPKVYQKQVTYIEDAYKKADEEDNTSSSSAESGSEAEIRSRLVPVTLKKKDGSLIKAMKDPKTGKFYAA